MSKQRWSWLRATLALTPLVRETGAPAPADPTPAPDPAIPATTPPLEEGRR